MAWVVRQLQEKGFRVLEAKKLPILYSEHSIRRQINVARSKLSRFKDRALMAAMEQSLNDLDKRMGKRLAQMFLHCSLYSLCLLCGIYFNLMYLRSFI